MENSNGTPASADFSVEGGGTVYLLRPLSSAAVEWIDEHIGPSNGFQPYYPTVVVEHRYIGDIVRGIQSDGLAVV